MLTVLLAVMQPAVAADTDGRAPTWALDTVDGEAITFERGPAVLMFWATWCPYCRALLPQVEAVRRDFAGRGVPFYALNVWEDGDPQAYFAEHGYGLTLVLAADLVAEDYGVTGTPAVFVVDADRRIVYRRRSGEEPAAVAAAMQAALDAALAGR